jgi:eukaryotic-like serine/threonine-protein kinase
VSGTEQWRRVDRLFHEAVALPSGERSAFLDAACEGDEALRHELETLLANDDPPLFQKSALSAAAHDMTATFESWVGRTLGSYEILEMLGAGGMGEVYRARDTSLGREVALKLLPQDVSSDPELVRRLQREARILASLNHQRIATLYGLEEAGGQRFLVMELVPGPTLAERLHKERLTSHDACSICRQIAEGLEAAHEAGIVHRDLKPGNVKITPDGSVKLLDFGLAKALDATTAAAAGPSSGIDSTREGSLLGTPAYMSPEQARGQVVDRRCDIWAFGCCLYECLTGRRAFTGDTVTDTLSAVLDKEPDWAALGDDVPPGPKRLVRRCLEKDVRRRLQHIGDARLDLEEAESPPEARSSSMRRAHSWPLLAGAAIVLLLAGWLGASIAGRRAAPPGDHRVTRLTLSADDEKVRSLRLQLNRFFIPFAISPDGERIVLRARGVVESQLYLRERSGFDLTPLPGTDAATSPFFSPDGHWIAFWRAEDRLLRKVSVVGGAVSELASTDSVHAAVWSSDDEIVIDTAYPGAELWSIPAGGGTPKAITVLDRKEGERIALRALVPASNDLLVASITPEGSWLDVLSRATGRRRRLIRGGANLPARYTSSGHLVFTDGDVLFGLALDQHLEPAGSPVPVLRGIDHYFAHSNIAISDEGTVAYVPEDQVREAGLSWLDRTGLTAVPGVQGPFAHAALSPDGKLAIAEFVNGPKSQLWIFDLERGTRRLLNVEGRAGEPIWSPDGKTITYVSYRHDHRTLCRTRADGTGPEDRVADRQGWPEPEDWSPDGRSLLFSEYTSRGDSDIWLYANGQTSPLISTKFSESRARFSPDGRSIAFEADDGGVSQVYLQTFPGSGPRITVSTGEAGSPQWSHDGRRLFYMAGHTLMAVDVQTTPTLHAGRPERALEVPMPWVFNGIAPGGRVLAFLPRTMDGPPQLRIVLNWFEELERLAPHAHK